DLYEYDVNRPWADRDEEDPNPRDLGQGNPHIGRPHALLAHPDGRHLIMGGTPGYGLTGGGLFIYDLEERSGVVLSEDDLLPEHSTNCLVALPDGNLVGGTTTMPGTGGETLAEEAELYVFDFAERKVAWREAILPGRSRIMDLLVAPDGLVYGLAVDSTFFVFDPVRREVIHQEPLKTYGSLAGAQAPRVMALGPDGNIYALFNTAIVRIEPGTFEHEKLADTPAPAVAGIALVGGRLYFCSNAELWSYGVPGLEE
ncbi:MAG TPA: hypothetical protein QGH10_22610, partial [Armatimonadota bacterium]|nr:hypothetical protein [Armatimonadota bacterium]